MTLTAEVSVQADSVNGVESVLLFCGPLDGGARPVYAWPSAPYVGLVDLSVCEGLTTPNPDGGTISLLQLSVLAYSSADAGSEDDFQVWLDATGPVISVTYPPSAQPKSPFTVVVNSNEPLSSLPVVTLAGAAADSVLSVPNTDGGTYIAFFQSTPGLGTDNYDGGSPIPIEVLTNTDEVVRLTVDATGLDGNTTAVDVSVDLSRLVWDRYIPGQPASSSPLTWAAEPIAFSGGLVLPLAITSGGGAGADWIPGVLAFADGTFYGFDVGVTLPGGLDGGYVARGLNAQGQTLFFDFTGNGSSLLLAPPPPATGPVVTGTLTGAEVSPPLTAVTGADGGPDLLCLQDTVAACSFPGADSLTCFTPKLTVVSASGSTSNGSGPPDAGVVAGAGGSYLSPNVGVNNCDSSISSWNLADLTAGTFSFGPYLDPNGTQRGCFIESIIRLLAVGDGTFVVQLHSGCGTVSALPPEYPILRVAPGPANGASRILGTYTAPLGTPRTVQLEVVGVLADGRVVTLSNNPPYTDFELWSLNPTATDVPDVIAPIAGLYDSADATEQSVVARSVHAGSDGSFAVLLSGAPLGVAVMAFGPGLQPLWLYLYPRVTSTADARLVSAPTVGDVYLVDEFNNRAASLRVEPMDAGTPLAPPSNLTYTTPDVYTEGTQITPNLPTYGGGAPTNYMVSPALPAGLQLDSTTGVISGTPSVVATTATYTITASNSAGSTTAVITLTVNPVAPLTLSYSSNPASYTVGTAITDNVPNYTGGTPTSFSVSPSLPAGLVLDTTTGIISGTPSTVTTAATFVVTASNSGGSVTVNLVIAVSAASACAICLGVYPNVVEVTPGGSASTYITATVPPGFNGSIQLTGTGSGGTLVMPMYFMYSPPKLSPIIAMGGTVPAGYGSYVTIYGLAGVGFPSGSVTVTGTADAGVTDTVNFTVQIVSESVVVMPNPWSMCLGGSATFNATLQPTPGSVTWSIDEGTAGGSITAGGVYTPTDVGTFHVRATTGTAFGEATVFVTPACP